MKVSLSAVGKFHTFDLARQLLRKGCLNEMFTAYPRFKLRNELPRKCVKTFPWLHAAYMAAPRQHLPHRVLREWEFLSRQTFGRYVGRNISKCDIYVGLSGSALPAGLVVKSSGGRFICDRGSTHIRAQDHLLQEEHAEWGLPYFRIDPRTIAAEEAEYALADLITVPSNFVKSTFIEQGLSGSKVEVLPYGVELTKFRKLADPIPGRLDIIFVGAMSLRKGIPYLLQAYRSVKHGNKSLTLVGEVSPRLIERMRSCGLWSQEVKVMGPVPQHLLSELLSRSHVMVLPSIEEGLALVQAQAMACGCPVVASSATGASDLFEDGVEGFIVPARDPNAIAERLRCIADDNELRQRLSINGMRKVSSIGGWDSYGNAAHATYTKLLQ